MYDIRLHKYLFVVAMKSILQSNGIYSQISKVYVNPQSATVYESLTEGCVISSAFSSQKDALATPQVA